MWWLIFPNMETCSIKHGGMHSFIVHSGLWSWNDAWSIVRLLVKAAMGFRLCVAIDSLPVSWKVGLYHDIPAFVYNNDGKPILNGDVWGWGFANSEHCSSSVVLVQVYWICLMDFRFVGDTNIGAWSVFGNPYSVIGCYRLFLMSPFEFLFFWLSGGWGGDVSVLCNYVGDHGRPMSSPVSISHVFDESITSLGSNLKLINSRWWFSFCTA